MKHRTCWRWIDRLGQGAVGVLFLLACWAPFAPGDYAAHERMLATSFGIALYIVVFLLATLLVAGSRRQAEGTARFVGAWRRALGWVWRWHGLTTLGILGGSLLGIILAALLGFLRAPSAGWAALLFKGAWNGGFYFLIWMPGLSLVVCFMQAFGPKNQPDGEKKFDNSYE